MDGIYIKLCVTDFVGECDRRICYQCINASERSVLVEEVMEYYGIGLLQILGGICAVTFWMTLFETDGLLHRVVVWYLQGICGS